jgi:hypothetical protein
MAFVLPWPRTLPASPPSPCPHPFFIPFRSEKSEEVRRQHDDGGLRSGGRERALHRVSRPPLAEHDNDKGHGHSGRVREVDGRGRSRVGRKQCAAGELRTARDSEEARRSRVEETARKAFEPLSKQLRAGSISLDDLDDALRSCGLEVKGDGRRKRLQEIGAEILAAANVMQARGNAPCHGGELSTASPRSRIDTLLSPVPSAR